MKGLPIFTSKELRQRISSAHLKVVPNRLPVRIAYDGKAYTDEDEGGGKGRYLSFALNEINQSAIGIIQEKTTDVTFPLVPYGKSSYLIWQQLTLPAVLRALKPHVFLAPYNTAPVFIGRNIKLVSIVHDLILLDPPAHARFLSRSKERYRGALQRHTMNRSDLILTVSRFTADAIAKVMPTKQVRVVHNTIARSWFAENIDKPDKAGGDRYLLLVTSNVPHKNAFRAMSAFARYKASHPKDPIRFRIAGVASSAALFHEKARELDIGDAVHIERFLSEPELQVLYRGAACVIVPSLKEGFGIPLLEAMASGVPAASSDRWSLPEVGGNAVEYFDPTNVEEMEAAITRILNDRDLHQSLSKRGMVQARSFHPDRIEERFRAFWKEVYQLSATSNLNDARAPRREANR